MFIYNIRKDSRSQNLAAHSLAPVVQVPSGPQLPHLTAWCVAGTNTDCDWDNHLIVF